MTKSSSSAASAQSGKQKSRVSREGGLIKSAKSHKRVNDGKVEKRIKQNHQVRIENGRKLPEKYQSESVRALDMKQSYPNRERACNKLCLHTRGAHKCKRDDAVAENTNPPFSSASFSQTAATPAHISSSSSAVTVDPATVHIPIDSQDVQTGDIFNYLQVFFDAMQRRNGMLKNLGEEEAFEWVMNMRCLNLNERTEWLHKSAPLLVEGCILRLIDPLLVHRDQVKKLRCRCGGFLQTNGVCKGFRLVKSLSSTIHILKLASYVCCHGCTAAKGGNSTVTYNALSPDIQDQLPLAYQNLEYLSTQRSSERFIQLLIELEAKFGSMSYA